MTKVIFLSCQYNLCLMGSADSLPKEATVDQIAKVKDSVVVDGDAVERLIGRRLKHGETVQVVCSEVL
jgi:hypothetical protein